MAEFLSTLSSAPRIRTEAHRCTKIGLTVILILAVAAPAAARGQRKHTPSPDQAPTGPGYVAALSVANRFLYAWQVGDLETGMVLLSDQIRHSQNPEKLERFFTAASSRSYEIARGKGNHSRYGFPVILISVPGAGIRRRASEIVVIRTGKSDWVVDKLP